MSSNDFGVAAVCSQVTGFLFLENVKMEKQRTNASYSSIIPRFLTPKTFVNGFLPYGALQAYSKGVIFGMNHRWVRPFCQKNQFSPSLTNVTIGATTGISEALLTSPLVYARVQMNKNVSDGTIGSNPFRNWSLLNLFRGAPVLMAKRVVDWSTRFAVIDKVKKYSPIASPAFNTFIGAALTTVVSSPIDRLLPIVYSQGNVMCTLREQQWSFLYKGFAFRALSTAQYTTCLLILPTYFQQFRDSLSCTPDK